MATITDTDTPSSGDAPSGDVQLPSTPVAEAPETAAPYQPIPDKESYNANVTINGPSFKDYPKGKDFPFFSYAIPAASTEDFRTALQGWKNISWGQDSKTLNWLNKINQGAAHYNEQDIFDKIVNTDGIDLQQTVKAGDTNLNIQRFMLGDGGGRKLTGEMAHMRMSQSLSLGALVSIPLWHSGIWITVKAPPEDEWIALEHLLQSDKNEFGTHTAGRVYSASGVYHIARVVDFVLKHLYEVSTESSTPSYLKTKILITDLPALVLGLLSASYPQGYPYSRVCVADPTVCRHVTEELISFAKLYFVSNSRINEKQRLHMRTVLNKKMSDKDLEAYQAQHSYDRLATIELNDITRVSLKVPTLMEAELAGREWIDDMTAQINEQLTEAMDEAALSKRVTELSKAQGARQYAAWVDRIAYSNGDGIPDDTVDDRKDVAEAIGRISAGSEFEDAFYTGVEAYIGQTTISVAAVPVYDCPNCGKGQKVKKGFEFHPNLITLDAVQTFFTLHSQKYRNILAR